MAEGEGFEPPRALRPGGFQVLPSPPPKYSDCRSSRDLARHRPLVRVGWPRVVKSGRGHRTGTPRGGGADPDSTSRTRTYALENRAAKLRASLPSHRHDG